MSYSDDFSRETLTAVAQFIRNHANLIGKRNFQELYNIFIRECNEHMGPDMDLAEVVPVLTALLLDCGVNPLDYLTDIPDSYAHGLNLVSIEIGNQVRSIGPYAFSANYHLTTVTFEKGSTLKSIDSSAFYFCESLTQISLPGSVTDIADCVFEDTPLTEISYGGTIKEFQRAYDDAWTFMSSNVSVVHCSDGDLSVD